MKLKGKPCSEIPSPPGPEIITVDDAPDCQAECGPSPPPPCPEIIAAMDTNDDQDKGEPSNSSSQKGPHTSEQLKLLAF